MRYDGLFLLLRERGIRRTELVKKGVLSAETLMRLRRNESVSLHTIEHLSRYLDCGLFDLMASDSAAENEINRENGERNAVFRHKMGANQHKT
ncbi:MAG: helix-turn-helix transcriptional regulator [Eubacteriales bacterium]|nr:helix-turn-helix transcriptional regulator [Eubacteriales bacterium]